MKNKIFFYGAVVAAVTLFLTPAAHATNGMKLIGVGPVQRAMGGASVGLPLDSAATITNPAGISRVGSRVDFGVTYFNPDVKYKANSTTGQVTNNDATISSDASAFVIPAFGMVLPSKTKFTFGIGAYGVSGMGVDYKSNLYNNVTYSKYGFLKFAPAMAYSWSDQLSVGIAPNINYAAMDFEAGATTQKAHHGGTAYGLGFTLGALYKATELLSFGLAYESKQNFPDFKFNTSAGTDRFEFNQPQSIAGGIGVRPNDRLRMAFDMAWINWSQTNGKDQPVYTENNRSASAWNMNWDDKFVYKAGVEFDLNSKLTLRGGYNYGKNPLDPVQAFEAIAFPAIAEHHITAGFGLNITEQFGLNVGLMYAPEVSFDVANSAQAINSATTSMSQYAVDVGIAYKF